MSSQRPERDKNLPSSHQHAVETIATAAGIVNSISPLVRYVGTSPVITGDEGASDYNK